MNGDSRTMSPLAHAIDLLIEAEFRKVGFTLEAAKYPLSDGAVRWLCAFNGVEREPSPAWRYAPNPTMQAYLERRAAA